METAAHEVSGHPLLRNIYTGYACRLIGGKSFGKLSDTSRLPESQNGPFVKTSTYSTAQIEAGQHFFRNLTQLRWFMLIKLQVSYQYVSASESLHVPDCV
jgi:hypothetical protein